MLAVQIGRKSFDYNTFTHAVFVSKKPKEVAVNLGLNPTVGSTIQNINNKITELQLNTSHFTYKYTKSEKFFNNNRKKDYQIAEINTPYFETMENRMDARSWSTYRCSLGNFLQSIGEQDFATVLPEQIEQYLNSQSNKATSRHISGLQ